MEFVLSSDKMFYKYSWSIKKASFMTEQKQLCCQKRENEKEKEKDKVMGCTHKSSRNDLIVVNKK